jgi:hypothetical protein
LKHLEDITTADLEAFRDTWEDGPLAKKKKQERSASSTTAYVWAGSKRTLLFHWVASARTDLHALSSLLDRLQSIAEEGQRRGEVSAAVDSVELATLIASTLEGSIMVSRLQKKEEPRNIAVRHLEEYLETKVRARKSKAGAAKS